MAALSPAQRRVLEAAQRGELHGLVRSNGITSAHEMTGPGRRRTVTAVAQSLAAAGLLEPDPAPVRPFSFTHPLRLTAAGRAELGITDTEEG